VDLELIGSSAIEDRLQDEVAETIQFLKQAGIQVWVLTGDKIETAVNIGVSAGLIDIEMEQLYIDEQDKGQLVEDLNSTFHQVLRNKGLVKQALIIAGSSLLLIEHDPFLKEKFLRITDQVDVVLACRVSPQQKADIVNLVKLRYPHDVTLSIGDGANDVNMIMQAHVGVGIAGKEGQQAARSADFAIGQFKFLKPLLFVHGREAYRRNSLLVLYSFYKNVLYVITQFYFGFFSAFSGQTLYDKVIYQLYNITTTSVPVMWFGVFDFQHLRDQPNPTSEQAHRLLLRNPALYDIGLKQKCFSSRLMLQWIFYALAQGAFIYFVNFSMTTLSPNPQGKMLGFWASGHIVYLVCVCVANAVILVRYNAYERIGVGFVVLMVGGFLLTFKVMSVTGWFPVISHVFSDSLGRWPVLLSIGFTVGLCTLVEILLKFWEQHGLNKKIKVQLEAEFAQVQKRIKAASLQRNMSIRAPQKTFVEQKSNKSLPSSRNNSVLPSTPSGTNLTMKLLQKEFFEEDRRSDKVNSSINRN
jgi:phospholipid-transporting ATPase